MAVPTRVRTFGGPLQPSSDPVTVARRAAPRTRVLTLVCEQKPTLRRAHSHRAVTVHAAETTLAIEADGEARVVRRTRPLWLSRHSPGHSSFCAK